jgi:hypothetical protein
MIESLNTISCVVKNNADITWSAFLLSQLNFCKGGEINE